MLASKQGDAASGYHTSRTTKQQLSSQSPPTTNSRKAVSAQNTIDQQLEIRAHLCLALAAKIEETDDIQGTSDRIPHCMMLRELRKAARYQFSREDYLREEGPTFNVLSWNMMCITPYHFYQSLASMGLLYEDDRLIINKST